MTGETAARPADALDLQALTGPEALQGRSIAALRDLADQVRAFLLSSISSTGGHIGANLGTVELTIALHAVFRSPEDALVWDTGHQGYTQKLLTGRRDLFASLNSYGGMNRFLTRAESAHDPIEASHAGTALSIALGMARGRRLAGTAGRVVAIVGDGALAEGIALEALNDAAVDPAPPILVVNDNGYAISPGYGGLHDALQDGARAAQIFRGWGFTSIGPVDGHDIAALLPALQAAKENGGPVVVHVRTVKGHGWPPADGHPFRQHFSFPFDPESGAAAVPPPAPGYPDVAAEAVAAAMEEDPRICCITPSTLYATGLAKVFATWPERCFDPGMEEQHAMSMTVGLALAGRVPVIAYQSTFMQRAFDQLIHDVCFMNLPTLILTFRSGFSGYDNPTHHGIYDLPYLRALPNLKVHVPKDAHEARRMVAAALATLSGPTVIAMPYGPAPEIDARVATLDDAAVFRPEVLRDGGNPLILAAGQKFEAAAAAADRLAAAGYETGLVNMRTLDPLDAGWLAERAARAARIVTVEEYVLPGGLGAAVAEILADSDLLRPLLRIGIPLSFVEPGSNAELEAAYGLDEAGILAAIGARWPDLALGPAA
ncbi:1-deoxy-D-xylulose-5-phosphate synthase [Marinibaculum pumilum]|uniref:1-deoxy-D-xylulose-5-phosphate synthase n=1 Tax=Marinibaculum pumilum TaxID=1766165 RepID=A0ABV7L427_9PROT